MEPQKKSRLGPIVGIGAACLGAACLIALIAVLLPPGPDPLTRRLSVVVDYGRVAPHLTDDLRDVVPEPGTRTEQHAGVGTKTLTMIVIGAKSYRHALFSPWRPATRAELLAFVREYPQESAKFTRICARGTEYPDADQAKQKLYPAVNYLKKSLGYVRITCTAQLIVITP